MKRVCGRRGMSSYDPSNDHGTVRFSNAKQQPLLRSRRKNRKRN